MTSSDPHQPLKKTIAEVKRCKEIMEARLSNGALVRRACYAEDAIECIEIAHARLTEAFNVLFPKGDS